MFFLGHLYRHPVDDAERQFALPNSQAKSDELKYNSAFPGARTRHELVLFKVSDGGSVMSPENLHIMKMFHDGLMNVTFTVDEIDAKRLLEAYNDLRNATSKKKVTLLSEYNKTFNIEEYNNLRSLTESSDKIILENTKNGSLRQIDNEILLRNQKVQGNLDSFSYNNETNGNKEVSKLQSGILNKFERATNEVELSNTAVYQSVNEDFGLYNESEGYQNTYKFRNLQFKTISESSGNQTQETLFFQDPVNIQFYNSSISPRQLAPSFQPHGFGILNRFPYRVPASQKNDTNSTGKNTSSKNEYYLDSPNFTSNKYMAPEPVEEIDQKTGYKVTKYKFHFGHVCARVQGGTCRRPSGILWMYKNIHDFGSPIPSPYVINTHTYQSFRTDMWLSPVGMKHDPKTEYVTSSKAAILEYQLSDQDFIRKYSMLWEKQFIKYCSEVQNKLENHYYNKQEGPQDLSMISENEFLTISSKEIKNYTQNNTLEDSKITKRLNTTVSTHIIEKSQTYSINDTKLSTTQEIPNTFSNITNITINQNTYSSKADNQPGIHSNITSIRTSKASSQDTFRSDTGSSDNPLNIYYNARRALSDELTDQTYIDSPKDYAIIGSLIAILIVYGWSVGYGCNIYTSRATSGVFGALAALLAYVGGAGLCYLAGLEHTTTASAAPFLVLGVGMDDSFVVINSYNMTYPLKSAEDRIVSAIRDCGLSISLTTLTNLLSFAIGTSTGYLAIRNFCILTFVGLLFGYITCLTILLGVLCIDARLEEERRIKFCGKIFLANRKAPDSIDKSRNILLKDFSTVFLIGYLTNQYLHKDFKSNSLSKIDQIKMILKPQDYISNTKKVSSSEDKEKSESKQNNNMCQSDTVSTISKSKINIQINEKPNGANKNLEYNAELDRSKLTESDKKFVLEGDSKVSTGSKLNFQNSLLSSSSSALLSIPIKEQQFLDTRHLSKQTRRVRNPSSNLIGNKIQKEESNIRFFTGDSYINSSVSAKQDLSGGSTKYDHIPKSNSFTSDSVILSKKQNSTTEDMRQLFPKSQSAFDLCLNGSSNLALSSESSSTLSIKSNSNLQNSQISDNEVNTKSKLTIYSAFSQETRDNLSTIIEEESLTESFPMEPQQNIGRKSRRFVIRYYARFLTMLPVRVGILLLSMVFFGVSIYSAVELKMGLDLKVLAPPSSQVYKFFVNHEVLFNKYGDITYLMFPASQNTNNQGDNTWWSSEFRESYRNLQEKIHNAWFTKLKLDGMSAFYDSLLIKGLPQDPQEYSKMLKAFIKSPYNRHFEDDFVFNSKSGELEAWRSILVPKYLPDTSVRGKYMTDIRHIMESTPNIKHPIAYSPLFIFYESDVSILPQTLYNMGCALIAVLLVS
ncbi:patched family protein [Cryptosporidium andersoni]|uniref:Patched family protein n=1 Tax=Cryptosporidium andersoni TaxID=117008 RepID=A0A1J4MS68_9CRYT|nr:patched family protein [Cryptosporidium andersoni]